MATFWEKKNAAHSVHRMFSSDYVYLLIWLFPILVSRVGLWFSLHQLLVIAYLLRFTFCQHEEGQIQRFGNTLEQFKMHKENSEH